MSVSYVLKEGLAGFKRARLSAFSSITAMMLAVILLGVLFRISTNAYDMAQAMKQDVEIEIFLSDISEARKSEIERELKANEIVYEVGYISEEEAMERFREEFGAGSDLLGDVAFLPASFRVRTATDVQAARIVEFVDEMRVYRGVEEVRFNQRGLEILEERLQLFVIGGLLLGGFIGFTALILVFNTIRLTIYAKRDLIKAMKLVGATNGFIKRPFMVEGMIQGLIAGVVGSGVVWMLFQYALPGYLPQIGVLSWPFGRWYYLTGMMIFTGLLLGFWGSRWAARKFIRQTTIAS